MAKQTQDFILLVKKVLKREYSFEFNDSISLDGVRYDLWDPLKGAFVEIIEHANKNKRSIILDRVLKTIRNLNKAEIEINYLYIIFNDKITQRDKEYYIKNLISTKYPIEILDREDLIRLSNKNVKKSIQGNAELKFSAGADIKDKAPQATPPEISVTDETSPIIEVKETTGLPNPMTALKATQGEFEPNTETNLSSKSIEDETAPATPTITNIETSETKSDDDLKREKFIDFVQEVLNISYSLGLEVEFKVLFGNKTVKIFDLADKLDMAFVEIIELSSSAKRSGIIEKVKDNVNSINSIYKNKNFKHFSVFYSDLNDKDREYYKRHFKSNNNVEHIILGRSDILKLAEENDIDSNNYLKTEKDDLNAPTNIETPVAGSNAANSFVSDSNNLSKSQESEFMLDDNNSAVKEQEEINDKIPFHLDQVVDEDKLGREPVAKAFVDLIKNDIFTDELKHSFMVHLQGKWGAGKSSFLNFIKENLNSGDEKWIIVEYNAWQNQHINPPWWTLIDQVYRKSLQQLNRRAYFHLWRKEVLRRIWRYSGWEKIIAFFIFFLSVLCIIYFGEDILNIFKETSEVSNENKDTIKKSFTSNFGDFLKLILTLTSIVGTLFAFAKFITVPFFINSSKEAKSFILRASDPMNKIKSHFNKLVDNINSKEKKRQLAIFIDDIDRCDKTFIVQLMEGIQTLFKDKRVLYIVAGDKDWISTSFGNIYEDFANRETNKNRLGEFFLEKAFQLSFRMPNISDEAKQNYWDHILGIDNKKDTKIESIDELSEDRQKEIKTVLAEGKSELTNPNFMKKFGEDFNLTGDTVSNIFIEEKNKDTEELKHLLQDFHAYIDTNPRSIIRLANNYTMTRSTLMAERAVFNEQKLFRWLVIEDLCPEVKSLISDAQNVKVIEEEVNKLKDLNKIKSCLTLLKDEDNIMYGEISIDEIKIIKGL